MILKTQLHNKISVKNIQQDISPPHLPQHPPNHIFSDDSQSEIGFSEKTNTQRRRKKIFQNRKTRDEQTFSGGNFLPAKADKKTPIEQQFSNSSFTKEGEMKEPKEYEEEKFPTVKNLNAKEQKGEVNKNKMKDVEEKFIELKTKIDKHENEIKILHNKLEKKFEKDFQAQTLFYKKIKKCETNQLATYNLSPHHQKTSFPHQSSNEKKNSKEFLETERTRRIQQLLKENQNLSLGLLKEERKVEEGMANLHFRDQSYNSISALQCKNDEESFDNGTIGELLSPFSLNPNDL